MPDALRFHPKNRVKLQRTFELTSEPGPDVVAAFCAPTFNISREFMERCPALKVVASHSTGTGHIDTKYAAARDIEVVYVHPEDAVNITAVAEHTIGLIVALTRNYTGAFSGIERGEWERWGCAGERMLSRMSLGIVGYGRIGKAVEKLAEPMFKNVLRSGS